jgi:magnesium transporter
VGYVTWAASVLQRDVPLRDITEDSFRTFHVEDEQGDVARAFERYHLISGPVVDDDDRLVGVITIDDAMTVLDEEHEEDILRLAGVGEGRCRTRSGPRRGSAFPGSSSTCSPLVSPRW